MVGNSNFVMMYLVRLNPISNYYIGKGTKCITFLKRENTPIKIAVFCTLKIYYLLI